MLKLIFFLMSLTFCWADHNPNIVAPCNLKDYDCIGKNLQANSRCSRNVQGYIPNKYIVPKFRFETPFFNSSYVDIDLVVGNHNKCFVSAFYFNKATKSAVIGIDCPNLYLESDRLLIRHQSLQEDSYYKFHIRATYPLVRITVILPSMTHMDLCRANVFTDVTTLPIMHVDPKDKPTTNYLSQDLTNLYIYEREAFFYYGDHLTKEFIDSILCNYGCERQILPVRSWDTQDIPELQNL